MSTSEAVVRRRLAWLIAAVVVVALMLRFSPALTVLDRLELRTIDWRFLRRGPRAADPRIVILEVDEESLREVDRWPWPRSRFAEVIRRLDRAGARAIAFDIFFAEPEAGEGSVVSDAQRGSDGELVEATREGGMVYHAAFGHALGQDTSGGPVRALARQSWSSARVVEGSGLNAAAELFEVGEVTSPLPGLIEAAAGVGFVNVVDSGDGVYRHILPVVRRDEMLFPSLPVAVAASMLQVRPEQVVIRPGDAVDLGGRRRIPIDSMGRMLVDFAGGSGTFPYVSATELLRSDPAAARERFEDRIVLVAVTAPGLYDLRASPFDSVYNGVETQANALANILERRFLRQAPGESCLLAVLLLAAVLYAGLSRLRPTWAVALVLALLVGYNWVALALFSGAGLAIDVATPNVVLLGCTLAALTVRLMGEESEQERVRDALSRFVPEGIMERAVGEDPAMLLQGQRRVVTVLFADLRSFTAKSEEMPPEQTVELLNRFFALVHETIFEFEGTLDKYMGDGLMAFWNAPVSQPDHALLALRTAVHLQRRIEYNQAEWEFHGMPELAAGIGISTGEAVVGYVGTRERMQYTAIGAHVNLAARLEAMTKEVGAPTLISSSTYELVAEAVQARPLGPVQVRGFSEPIEIYEVLDLRSG
ncbi:MAG: adenylate/guanylate cyclase domain-containing protein [Armatimonadota bacterium]|nr:adenylate/guanylate cyclase domain-containing protein [Armatimonadota bacterium]